jgi:hypothetical protein
VVTGVWANGTFTPSVDPEVVNAVQVKTGFDDVTPLFSAVALQQDVLGASACSLGVAGPPQGASAVPWYLPFALPTCIFDEHTTAELQTMEFRLNPAGVDNVGWARVGAAPNASWISSQLEGIEPCMTIWASGSRLETACGTTQVGDMVYLNNGTITPALQTLHQEMDVAVPWDTSLWGALPAQHTASTLSATTYGKVFAGPIPLFDSDSHCTASGSWNENLPIVGFAWGVVYDVNAAGDDKTFWMRIDPDDSYHVGTLWGGPDHGVTVLAPAKAVDCPMP